MMSERDLQRIEVLTLVLARWRTVGLAATVLDLGVRQVGQADAAIGNSIDRLSQHCVAYGQSPM